MRLFADLLEWLFSFRVSAVERTLLWLYHFCVCVTCRLTGACDSGGAMSRGVANSATPTPPPWLVLCRIDLRTAVTNLIAFGQLAVVNVR